jgi:hypothetical protein
MPASVNYLQAFEAWVSTLPTNILQCRDPSRGHRFVDWEDKRARARGVMGWVQIEVPCLRRCGTLLTQFVDPDTGYITRSNRVRYDYEKWYLIPDEARSGHGITRAMNAVIRAERLQRMAERGQIDPEELDESPNGDAPNPA